MSEKDPPLWLLKVRARGAALYLIRGHAEEALKVATRDCRKRGDKHLRDALRLLIAACDEQLYGE